MTPLELVEYLGNCGEDEGTEYNDGLEGWFGWDLRFENGDRVLTVSFEDSETNEISNASWILTRKEAK